MLLYLCSLGTNGLNNYVRIYGLTMLLYFCSLGTIGLLLSVID